MYRNPWKRRLKFISVGLILFLSALAIASIIAEQSKTETIDLRWDLVSGEISAESKQILESAIKQVPREMLSGSLVIRGIATTNNLAYMAAIDPSREDVEGLELYAKVDGNRWRVIMPDDPEFCDTLLKVSAEIVGGNDPFSYYTECEA